MPLRIGIVGLPNVGKSTLFNALIRSKGAEAANYPFCTIEPNVGVVAVPDERLERLAALVKPEKIVPTVIEFVDIAGLVAGASKGEGLGNKFLSHIREVNAICEVVRLFPDDNVTHVEGTIDGKRDIATIETELILADLQTVERRLHTIVGAAKSGRGEARVERAVLESLKAALDSGKLAATVALPPDYPSVGSLQLLTRKPLLYAVNASEDQLGKLSLEEVRQGLGLGLGLGTILVCAKVEEELLSLSLEEGKEYLKSLGVKESGLEQLIRAAYHLLGLLTFFTAGPKEVRAWTVKRGAKAPEAAGVIHSDFQRGFICAETISYSDFVACGSEHSAKENPSPQSSAAARGKMRTEGKEYTVQDGDVMHFRFNV